MRPAAENLLHRLRVAGPAVIANAGRSATDELVAAGFARKVRDRLVLTDTGRAAHADRMAAQVADSEVRRAVEAAFGAFSLLNERLLEACTTFQMSSDRSEAKGAVAELMRIDDAIQEQARDLASRLSRFDHHLERLYSAREKVRRGDLQWFTSPTCASYHSVWFELHEDFLATLGMSRTTH